MMFILSALLTVLVALIPVADATTYTYHTVDVAFPGVTTAAVTGLNLSDELVGVYVDDNARVHGFYMASDGCVLPLLRTTPRGIGPAGTIAGFFHSDNGDIQGFLYTAGTLRGIQVPRPRPFAPVTTRTEILGINDAGVVVGTFQSGEDGLSRGFRYDPMAQTFTTIEVPGAQSTLLVGLDTQGRLLGVTVGGDGVRRVFRWENGAFTFLTIPALPNIDPVGHTDSGLLAGNNLDTNKGFVYDGATVTVIEVPGATLTQLRGMRQDGTVYGRYNDTAGVTHGFVATPAGVAPPVVPEPPPTRERDTHPPRKYRTR